MKRLLALLMFLCLAMFVVGCGSPPADQPEGDGTEETDGGGGDATNGGEADTAGDTADAGEGGGELEMLDMSFGNEPTDSPLTPAEPDVGGIEPLKPSE